MTSPFVHLTQTKVTGGRGAAPELLTGLSPSTNAPPVGRSPTDPLPPGRGKRAAGYATCCFFSPFQTDDKQRQR